MTDSLKRFQDLLRELFQLEYSDVDTGIYRLFRLRKDEVERFIKEELPDTVDAAFGTVLSEQKGQLEQQLEKKKNEIRSTLGEAAIQEDDSIAEAFASTPLVKEYEGIRKRLAELCISEEQKRDVFNHLYNFFSRYYDEGDFLPLRRYGSKTESYAVPYNGEEVMFYWATKGMHYIKTGEQFRDYQFEPEQQPLGKKWKIRFKVTDANVPKDNTKGDTRYFFPIPDGIEVDELEAVLTIPFHYRLPTEAEAADEDYKATKKAKNLDQQKIIQNALPIIWDAIGEKAEFLDQSLKQPVGEGDKAVPLLEKRMLHFARRNTTDYFICPFLKDFLERELELYLKDWVFSLEDLKGDFPAKWRSVEVIRKVASKVIEFLDSIEQVQNRLWEKPKFVLQTDWLVPIRHVPEELWDDVLQKKAQLAEWRDWFATPETVDAHFLETHPTLVLNTAYFDEAFKLRLLESLPFDSIEDATDGLLINSENWQALNVLKYKYAGKVKCIYIDPPYNTEQDRQSGRFLYKDNYEHSTWLAMMENRLTLDARLLSHSGAHFISSDESELHRLVSLSERYGRLYHGLFTWRRTRTGGHLSNAFNQLSDYVVVTTNRGAACLYGGQADPEESQPLTKASNNRKELLFRAGSLEFMDFEEGVLPQDYEGTGSNPVRCVTSVHVRGGRNVNEAILEGPFVWTQEKLEDELDSGAKIVVKRYRNLALRFLRQPKGHKPLPSLADKHFPVGTNEDGSEMLTALGFVNRFTYPKPVDLLERIVESTGFFDKSLVVLDYFAGSGTTGHAVINLNREDGGQRKFILVEMGEYFDTVLLPRIAKVMYAPEWKDGKPKQEPVFDGLLKDGLPEWVERTPRLIKVLRLESYEDAMHNLSATAEKLASQEGSTVPLHYIFEQPMRLSDTMLNVDKLERPFSYTLEVLTDSGPKEKHVDLVETAIMLLELSVDKYESWKDDSGREYLAVKAHKDDRKWLLIWRNMDGLDIEAERTFLEPRIAGFDEVRINGDCAVPGIASVDLDLARIWEV